MRNIQFKTFILILTILSLKPTTEAQTVTICSQAGTVYGITDSQHSELRAAIDANCSTSFNYVGLTGEITLANLNANGCQIWFGTAQDNSGGAPGSPGRLNHDEQAALGAWYNAGGYIVTACVTNSNLFGVCDVLGVSTGGSTNGGGTTFSATPTVATSCSLTGTPSYAGAAGVGNFTPSGEFVTFATGGDPTASPSTVTGMISPNAVILGTPNVSFNFAISNNPGNASLMTALMCNAAEAINGQDGCVNTATGVSSAPSCNAGSAAPIFTTN